MSRSVTLVRPQVERIDYEQHHTQVPGTPLPPKGEGGGTGRTRPAFFREQGNQQANQATLVSQALALTKAERKQILDRLALSLVDSDQGRGVDQWSVAVSSALEARLGSSGVASYGPVLAKKICGALSAYKPVATFIEEAGIDALTVTERQAALNFLAELVVDEAARIGRIKDIPLGLNLVATCSANVRGIFDVAFPGYIEAGLARVVLKRTASRASWDGDREVAE